MRLHLGLLALLTVTACGDSPPAQPADVLGPFTGTTRRFVVDRIDLPTNRDHAGDLNGDGNNDNNLSGVLSALRTFNNFDDAAVPGMITSGALAPIVEITSDDPALASDGTVGVRWIGGPGDGGDAVGGTLASGTFTSNRTRFTTHPATMTVRLPVTMDADPIALSVVGVEIDLTRDGDGFSGELHGVVRTPVFDRVWPAFRSMLDAQPEEHRVIYNFLDMSPKDGVVTFEEFRDDKVLVGGVLLPDLRMFDDAGAWSPVRMRTTMNDALSIGFGFHLKPCDAGRCLDAGAPRCDDRVKNGDETDVDCGGSCHPCAAARACAKAGDCQSSACDGGMCAASTCGDGKKDGFETDVDCGGYCAGYCIGGQVCARDEDCDSGRCSWGICAKK